jgi:hypothetical protein
MKKSMRRECKTAATLSCIEHLAALAKAEKKKKSLMPKRFLKKIESYGYRTGIYAGDRRGVKMERDAPPHSLLGFYFMSMEE